MKKQKYCVDCNKKLGDPRSRRCQSCANKGILNPIYIDGRTLKKHYCKECNKIISFIGAIYGSDFCQSCSRKGERNKNKRRIPAKFCIDCGEEVSRYGLVKRCYSCENIRRWEDEKYRLKIVKSFNRKQNNWEKELGQVLNKLLPREYKFVGDGKVILGSFCPDFININGQKKIIELFGSYWHNRKSYKKRDARKLRVYKKYGYKTLIIRDPDLKNFSILKTKLEKFNQ